MKRIILIIAVSASVTLAASAQLFIGGSAGIDYTGGKNTAGSISQDRPARLTVQFEPKVGFYFTDDFAVGLEAGMTVVARVTPNYGGSGDDQAFSSVGWQLGAFARYHIAGTELLTLMLEGGFAIGGYGSSTKTGAITVDHNPASHFSIGALPVLAFKLSERLNIEARSNFLRLGFAIETVTNATNSDNKTTSTHFGFGVNAGSPVANLTYGNTPLFMLGIVLKL